MSYLLVVDEPTMFCLKCSYPLDGLNAISCPECGRPFNPSVHTSFARQPRKGIAWEVVASFICGLLFNLMLFATPRPKPDIMWLIEIPPFVFWVVLACSGLRKHSRKNKVLSLMSLALVLNPLCIEFLYHFAFLILNVLGLW